MSKLTNSCLLMLSCILMMSCGCSETTQREAGEAVEQTGQAIENAAEDAANVVGGAIEGASDAANENQAKPDSELPNT